MKQILMLFFMTVFCAQLMSDYDITWDSPATLSSTMNNASDQWVGISSSGNSVAIWQENSLIKSKNKPFGMSWGSVNTLSGSGASAPRLVVDSSGNATALWLESGVVKTATQLSGMSWGSATTLSSSGAANPAISVDPNGDVVAIWDRSGFIETSTKTFGGSWPGSPEIIATSGGSLPQVAIGGDSLTVVAVWQDTSGDVFSNDKLIGNPWTQGTLGVGGVSIGTGVNPQVAVDSTGNAAAVWYAFDVDGADYSNVALTGNTKPFGAGGSWDGLTPISQTFGIRNPADPATPLVARVAYNGNGIPVAYWTNSFDGSTFSVEFATRTANQLGTIQWNDPILIANSNENAYSLDLSVVSRGDAFTTYMFKDGSSSDIAIQAEAFDISAVFVQTNGGSTISTGTPNGYPRIAASLNGNTFYAVTAWRMNDGSHNNVLASSGSGTVILPPTGLSVSQLTNTQGIFTEYVDSLTWTASASSDVTSYIIFRDGQVINQVGTNVGTAMNPYVDTNRILNEPGSGYGVAAIDDDFAQSTIATVAFP